MGWFVADELKITASAALAIYFIDTIILGFKSSIFFRNKSEKSQQSPGCTFPRKQPVVPTPKAKINNTKCSYLSCGAPVFMCTTNVLDKSPVSQ